MNRLAILESYKAQEEEIKSSMRREQELTNIAILESNKNATANASIAIEEVANDSPEEMLD